MSDWLPLGVLLSSLLAGLVIFFLPEHRERTRTVLNLLAASVKLGLVAVLAGGVYLERSFEFRTAFLPGADLVLRADAFSILFVALSAVLWFITTIYAVGYLEGTGHRSRFFGFFSICVSATMGVALAGNLITLFVFYELLTVSTYPLVVHKGTPQALRAGDLYLKYTLAGGTVLLAGVAWVYALAGTIEFRPGGTLSGVAEHRGPLIAIFILLIGGLGVKAALAPLHGWLPVAMIAPAPVSALLHAVAVVKAGAFGITRVVYDLYGAPFAQQLGVSLPLAVVAAVTILFGSVKALHQRDLKLRLAYSTVSQVSYIVLGVAMFGTWSTVGGLVHLVHQGLMKITLFFCAGNLSAELGIHAVDELNGTGRRMPLTMAAFTVAALGMIGVPPIAGFISKWYLGIGAVQAGQGWALAVLVVSGLLNAAYFLPLIYSAWFGAPGPAAARLRRQRSEVSLWLLLPTLAAAALSIWAGLFAGNLFTPLTWARLIAIREFSP